MTLSPQFRTIAQRVADIEKKAAEEKKITAKDMEFIAKIEKLATVGRPAEGSNTLPVYNSMTNCEASTGIPVLVQKQSKAEGCDAFRFARVDLGKLLRFLFAERPKEKQKGDPTTDGAEIPTTARGWLEYWKMRREKMRFERENESVVSRDEIREGLQKALAEFYGALDRIFCTELPPILVGAPDERTIRARCKNHIEKLKTGLKDKFSQMTSEDAEKDSDKEKGTE